MSRHNDQVITHWKTHITIIKLPLKCRQFVECLNDLFLNPRPTKPFCNTVYQVGWLPPPVNLKITPHTCDWYYSIAWGLLFPYISKSIPKSRVWCYSDVIILSELKITDFLVKYRPKLEKKWKFRKKSSKYQNFTGLLAYNRRKWHFRYTQ